MAVIAVVDDEQVIVDSASAIIRRLGHRVVVARNIRDSIDLISTERPDVVFMDVHLPDGDADKALDLIDQVDSQATVILFSGDLEVETSTRAVRAGAFEYLTKPFTYESLSNAVDEALKHRENKFSRLDTQEESAPVRNVAARRLVGESPGICRANLLIERYSKTSETPVLITGESGTGKELAASALHTIGGRKSGPFIKLNCAAIPRALMEAELFGHEKGSFTDAKTSRAGVFELAHKGTLFLDEIGELDLDLQPKLLRVLEEKVVTRIGANVPRTVDVRVVAATNRHLPTFCREGRFREDLYFRLAVLQLDLPPLRDRKEDIPIISEMFLNERANALGRYFTGFSSEVMDYFLRYTWPGNVRELRNLIERLIILSPSHGILHMPRSEMNQNVFQPLQFDSQHGPETSSAAPESFDSNPKGDGRIMTLDEAERNYIIKVLVKFDYNKTLAAKALGIARSTLNRKLARYDIDNYDESSTE